MFKVSKKVLLIEEFSINRGNLLWYGNVQIGHRKMFISVEFRFSMDLVIALVDIDCMWMEQVMVVVGV